MILDRLLGRKREPEKLAYYRGADAYDHRKAWKPHDAHPHQIWRADITELRQRSRDLVRNGGLAGSYVDKLQEYVVGTGITPKPAAMKSRTGKQMLKDFNTQAASLWEAMVPLFDLSGQQDIYEVFATALKTYHESGMALIHMPIVNDPNLPVRMGVFGFEPDYLAWDWTNGDTGNEVRGGIEIEQGTRRVVAFWIMPETFMGYRDYSALTRVPAEEMAWIFNLTRWGQTTGIPTFARVMGELYDHQQYVESEIVRADWSARQTHYIKTPYVPQRVEQMRTDPQAPQEPPEEDVPRGVIKYLFQNEDVIETGAKVPPSSFKEFMVTNMRKISAGLGMSYELLTGDHSGTHFSASRAVWVRDNKFIRLQQEHLVKHICQRVYARMIDIAVMSGALPTTIADYFDNADARRRMQKCKWLPPGVPWHDPAKDIQAASQAIALGIRSRSDICASLGVEFETVLDRLQEEENAIEERDLKGISQPGDLTTPLFPDEEEQAAAGEEDETVQRRAAGLNGKGRISGADLLEITP